MSRAWLHQVALAVDQLVNALAGGWADETISARAWRQRDKRRWAIAVRVIDRLFFWQEAHCRGAYNVEIKRRHLPGAYSQKIS